MRPKVAEEIGNKVRKMALSMLMRLRFLNQDKGGGRGGPSYIDEFKLKKIVKL